MVEKDHVIVKGVVTQRVLRNINVASILKEESEARTGKVRVTLKIPNGVRMTLSDALRSVGAHTIEAIEQVA